MIKNMLNKLIKSYIHITLKINITYLDLFKMPLNLSSESLIIRNISSVDNKRPDYKITTDYAYLPILLIGTAVHFIIMTYWEPTFSIFSIFANVCSQLM